MVFGVAAAGLAGLLLWRNHARSRALVNDFLSPFQRGADSLGRRADAQSFFAKSKVELIQEIEELRAKLAERKPHLAER